MLSSEFLQSFSVCHGDIIPEQEYSRDYSCNVKGVLSLLSERQDIPAIISIFSVYFPFLSKALQHDNSHQPGSVQTSSSIITGLCAQERAQGLLHKGAVPSNRHNKRQFIKIEQNTPQFWNKYETYWVRQQGGRAGQGQEAARCLHYACPVFLTSKDFEQNRTLLPVCMNSWTERDGERNKSHIFLPCVCTGISKEQCDVEVVPTLQHPRCQKKLLPHSVSK